MFLDEARLAARIRHPNVVPTLDVVADDGELFLVMEYVQGESLVAPLARGVREEAARGAAARRRGVMVGALARPARRARSARRARRAARHRAPRRVAAEHPRRRRRRAARARLRRREGRGSLADDARAGSSRASSRTWRPSSSARRPSIAATDIFAASIVLWETLTARRLFAGDNESAVLTAVLFGDLEPPSKYAPDVPPALDAIVLRGLARDRDETLEHRARAWRTRSRTRSLRRPRGRSRSGSTDLAHDALAARAKRARRRSRARRAGRSADGDVLARSARPRAARSSPPRGSRTCRRSRTRPCPFERAFPASGAAGSCPPSRSRSWARSPWGVLAYANRTTSVAPAPSVTASASAPLAVPTAVTTTASSIAATSASAPATQTAAKPTIKKPTVDCSNPYTRDELGRKIYKRECLE